MQTANTGAAPTQRLHAWQRGDGDAFGRIVGAVHGELLRMAGSRLRTADGQTLSRGDLLNEALLRLMQGTQPDWRSRAHCFATVSLTMRSVLVDHARQRLAAKRGGDAERATRTLEAFGEASLAADLPTLDALLRQLQAADPRAAAVLQLTCFAGLARDEIALVLDVSAATVDRELRFARAWLGEQLGRPLQG